MAYGGDPSGSDIDAVRFWAADTGVPPLLSDGEIAYLIDFYLVDTPDSTVSPVLVAALAADRIASKYAGYVSISADGVNYSGDQLQQRYAALGKELREAEKRLREAGAGPYVGGILIGDGPAPGTRQPNFGLGMHDNPEAGNQESGYLGEYGPNEPADILYSP